MSINIGILSKNDVLYVSDSNIQPILDLARYSISFGKNLFRDSQLVEFSHEPFDLPPRSAIENTRDNGSFQPAVQENVLFKFLANKSGDTIAFCATYPSDEDLKANDIASLSIEQFLAQKKAFMQAITKRFVEVMDIEALFNAPENHTAKSISRFLLNQIMSDLHREIVQASQLLFKDDHASLDRFAETRPRNCTFIFSAVMHDSIACASRFFRNLSGIFKLKMSENTQYADTLIGNLIAAQLSTIISSAVTLAKTRIRQVDLKVLDSETEEFFHVTFHPVKNDYILVIFAKGDPIALRFFTETTARTLASMKIFDTTFTGNVAAFKTVEQFLDTLPSAFDFNASNGTCEEIDYLQQEVDALDDDLNEQLNSDNDKNEQNGLILGSVESEVRLFAKFKPQLHSLQLQTNREIDQNKLELAARKAKLSCLLSLKIGNKILGYYYGKKFNDLNNLAMNPISNQLDVQNLSITCRQNDKNTEILLK